jgi:2-keto-4-pentenoate hydratase/2-oxohepta-3-ene-1,7-dioic acid hydratase in catechol pathway
MKILCIGRNYAKHAKELGNAVPTEPMIFMKPESALNYSGELVYPGFTNDLHYELEIVLEINNTASNVSLEQASKYYDRIGLGIDFTARDIQSECKSKGHPWEKAKAFDNSAPMSNRLMSKNLFDIDNINFKLEVNNSIVQDGNTKNLIFRFDHLISYASQFFTLEKGDLIYTGTPEGVGPVNKGDILVGYLGEEKLLEVLIK